MVVYFLKVTAPTRFTTNLIREARCEHYVFRGHFTNQRIELFIRDDMSDAAKESASMLVGPTLERLRWWCEHNAKLMRRHQSKHGQFLWKSLNLLMAISRNLKWENLACGWASHSPASSIQSRRRSAVMVGDSWRNALGYYEYRATMLPHEQQWITRWRWLLLAALLWMANSHVAPWWRDTTAALLRQARNDDKVKAVVLRRDSPGSAFASEVIRNEIEAIGRG